MNHQSILTDLIITYTEQIDEYDRMCADYAIVCVSVAGIIFGSIITLLIHRHRAAEKYTVIESEEEMNSGESHHKTPYRGHRFSRSFVKEMANINRAISILFLLFPAIEIILLYVTTISCKKVALYRGYLMWLEDELGHTTSLGFSFNKRIIDDVFCISHTLSNDSDSHTFFTFYAGFFVMLLTITLVLLLSFRFSSYYSNIEQERLWGTIFSRWYRGTFPIYAIICVVFNAICIFDLANNNETTKRVYEDARFYGNQYDSIQSSSLIYFEKIYPDEDSMKNTIFERNNIYAQQEYRYMNVYSSPTDIVFLGDSITRYCEWSELYPGLRVKNRGIGGDTTEGILARIDSIIKTKPSNVVILAGINDIFQGGDKEKIVLNIQTIVNRLKDADSNVNVFVVSVLPVRDDIEINGRVNALNEWMELNLVDCIFVDCNDSFSENGKLKPLYAYDDVHLTAQGYDLLKQKIDEVLCDYLDYSFSAEGGGTNLPVAPSFSHKK